MIKYKVGILVPDLINIGGLSTVAKFFYSILKNSNEFNPSYISIPQSFRDPYSIHVHKPSTWFKKIEATNHKIDNVEFMHYGKTFPEIELFLYNPNRELTKYLDSFDLIQVIAGSPAWIKIVKNIKKPKILQFATLVQLERHFSFSPKIPLRYLYYKIMTGYVSFLEKNVIKISDKVIVENQLMYDWTKDFIDSKNILFIPPGIDINIYKPTNSQDKEPYLLSVGRLSDPRKNIILLFKAFANVLKSRNSSIKLKLVSSTKIPNSLVKLANDLGIQNSIDIEYKVSRERLVKLYQNATLFVLSSFEEGLGMVILEAMACGIPIVSTDCGGPSTLIEVGENGFLTLNNNVNDLAQKIIHCLNNPDMLDNMGKHSRNIAVTKFNRDLIGEKIINLYKQLL